MIRDLFQQHFRHAPSHVAAAPGRLEFIGNHTDYNGGMVMGLSVKEGLCVAVSARNDRRLCLYADSLKSTLEISLDALAPLPPEHNWANYPLGVLHCLHQIGMKTPHGFNLAITSDLPSGAGMSSSAALELASCVAFTALYQHPLPTKDMARLCRRAENEFVGVPCGLLDQGVSAFGELGKLVKIDCKTETFSTVPLPDVAFWVFNTGKKHALLDSLYATRHSECMNARDALQQRFPELTCLADATETQLDAVAAALPAPTVQRARHVIREHARVKDVETLLHSGDIAAVGRRLFDSHASSRLLFENSCAELDTLVELLHATPGVLGARLTGGGFGGAVMAMTTPRFDEAAANAIAKAYAARHGHAATLFRTTTGHGARLL